MARKFKTYQAALGFFDTAVAAPSMKAALEIWGAKSNLFHQGLARETDDAEAVAATTAKPGVVLKRPIGSDGPFDENSDLPEYFSDKVRRRKTAKHTKRKRPVSKSEDSAAARKATLAYEKQRKRREKKERDEEARREKARQRQAQAVAKAQFAIDKAKRDHEARAGKIDAERSAVEKHSHAENERWEKQKRKLDKALIRAKR